MLFPIVVLLLIFFVSDDEIFIDQNNNVTVIPPIRWAASSSVLDHIQINYKPPESLSLQKCNDVQILHKKFIWKLAVLLYTSAYSTCPWSFIDGNNGQVRAMTINLCPRATLL